MKRKSAILALSLLVAGAALAEERDDRVRWLAVKGRKVIVWAHNYHVLRDLQFPGAAEILDKQGKSFAGPMGRHLAKVLGRDLYVIGFLSHYGQRRETARRGRARLGSATIGSFELLPETTSPVP